MRDLVILVHAAPEVLPMYRAAIGDGPELVLVNAGSMSSSYIDYAARRYRGGKILPSIIAENGLLGRQFNKTFLVSFSAGYALARRMLETDLDSIDGYVAIDSVHYSESRQLTPFATFAELSRRGLRTFWLGHTDVPTTGYKSTTESALKIAELAGGTGGLFVRRAYDMEDAAKAEHISALTVWGPAFVREAMDAAHGRLGWRDPDLTVAERCVLWSLSEMAIGVREVPLGSNTGPRIRDYLAKCERNGKKVGLDAAEWCAAFASAAQQACGTSGEAHQYRISGEEIEKDAKANGRWYTMEKHACPKVGDLCILKRGSEAWQRHVCRVVDFDTTTGAMVTIGGNEGGTIRLTKRNYNDPAVLGFVNYGGHSEKSVDIDLAVRAALANA